MLYNESKKVLLYPEADPQPGTSIKVTPYETLNGRIRWNAKVVGFNATSYSSLIGDSIKAQSAVDSLRMAARELDNKRDFIEKELKDLV